MNRFLSIYFCEEGGRWSSRLLFNLWSKRQSSELNVSEWISSWWSTHHELIPLFRLTRPLGKNISLISISGYTKFQKCKNGQNECSHLCINTSGSYECACRHGFQLADDKKTCVDIDECQVISFPDLNRLKSCTKFLCQTLQLNGIFLPVRSYEKFFRRKMLE